MESGKLRAYLEALKSRGVLTGPIKASGDTHYGIRCMFAKWRHEKGKDSRPSMTVKIDNGGASTVKCHACQYRGTLAEALTTLNMYHIGTITDLVEMAKEEDGKASPPTWDNSNPIEITTDFTIELKKLQLNRFPQKAIKFLTDKGCSHRIALKMFCAWIDEYTATNASGDPYTINEALVFPVISRKNKQLVCTGAQARELESPAWKSKYTTIFKFPSGRYMFGEHRLKYVEGEILYIVEGPLDAMHLVEQGVHSTAVLGVFMSKGRLIKIKRARPKQVIILPDQDSPGLRAAARMNELLLTHDINSAIINVGKDPKKLTKQDLINI